MAFLKHFAHNAARKTKDEKTKDKDKTKHSDLFFLHVLQF